MLIQLNLPVQNIQYVRLSLAPNDKKKVARVCGTVRVTGGGQVFVVSGDWGQKWVVIWWLRPKMGGDLVILRGGGD